MVLSPDLWELAENGMLSPNVVVEVTELKVWYDETVIGSTGFLLCTGLEVVVSVLDPEWPLGAIVSAAEGGVTWSQLEPESNQEPRPLTDVRGCYVNGVDEHSLPPGVAWERGSLDMDGEEVAEFEEWVEAGTLMSLAAAVEEFLPNKVSAIPLVGRISAKQSLQYFGSRASAVRYPYKFSFVLEDLSGRLEAVVWQSACAEYWGNLEVGDLIVLSNYRTKRSYNVKDAWELSVNVSNPRALIKRVPPGLESAFPLPMPPLDYIPIGVASFVPDKTTFDVAGVIVSLSRAESAARKKSSARSVFRFVELADETGSEFGLKLYRAGNERVFDSLGVGDVVLVTAVVMASGVLNSVDGRLLSAYSTSFSNVVLDPPGSPGFPYDISGAVALEALFKTRAQDRKRMISEVSFGPVTAIPQIPFEMYRALAPDVRPIPLAHVISDLLPSLRPLESRSVFLQGKIVRVALKHPVVVGYDTFADIELESWLESHPGKAAKSRKKGKGKTAGASAGAGPTPEEEAEFVASLPHGSLTRGPFVVVDTLVDERTEEMVHQHSEAHYLIQAGGSVPPHWEITIADVNNTALMDLAIDARAYFDSSQPFGIDVDALPMALIWALNAAFVPPIPALADPAAYKDDLIALLDLVADVVQDQRYVFRTNLHALGPVSTDGRFLHASLVSAFNSTSIATDPSAS